MNYGSVITKEGCLGWLRKQNHYSYMSNTVRTYIHAIYPELDYIRVHSDIILIGPTTNEEDDVTFPSPDWVYDLRNWEMTQNEVPVPEVIRYLEEQELS